VECELLNYNRLVEKGINKRKGELIELRTPSDLPEELWERTHRHGIIIEDVYVIYERSRGESETSRIWEVSIQAIAFRDGCIGLRIAHYKDGRIIQAPMVNYIWVLRELKQEVEKTTVIKSLLKELVSTRG